MWLLLAASCCALLNMQILKALIVHVYTNSLVGGGEGMVGGVIWLARLARWLNMANQSWLVFLKLNY